MYEDSIPKIINALEQMEKTGFCNFRDMKYYLKNANSIWDRSPFKVKDLVRLNKTPEITIEKSWGLLSAKHFLVEGALARVQTREFYDGHFVFGLYFEEETWLSSIDGKKNVPDRKSLYCFGESYLEGASYQSLTCEAL